MIKCLIKSLTLAFGIVTAIFTFVPESTFSKIEWVKSESLDKLNLSSNLSVENINIIISRLFCFLIILILSMFVRTIYLWLRRRRTIQGDNYSIVIEYGDILKKKKCKKVINFDECYTTKVGENTEDIKARSICGQFLAQNPNINIQKLIEASHVRPASDKSKCHNLTRYESGTIIPYGEWLLMAFARLDEKGKGRFFTRDEYLLCLDLLWKEIENHYAGKDVCIPVLGAGITSFDAASGASISQQDLLNLIIWSYKLSSHKIKSPHKLHIVCSKNKDFSINRIDGI